MKAASLLIHHNYAAGSNANPSFSTFFCKFIDQRHFQYVTMDTDSAYMALSGPMDKLVPEACRREYYETYHLWFRRRACEEHKKDFVDTRCGGEVWSDGGQVSCMGVNAMTGAHPVY